MFSQLRQGGQIYILEKGESKLTLKIGQIVNTGTPTPVHTTQTVGLTYGFQPNMEMVIRANVDGTEGDFPHLPCDKCSHDYGNMIICDSRECALSEVDAINQRSTQIIDPVNIKNLRSIVASCKDIFKVLNPNFAKEEARDEAINLLNERLDNFEKRVGQSLGNIEKFLSKSVKP